LTLYLFFLASHPGRVWRRSELIQEVWEYAYVGDQRVVDVHIGQIRKKIEIDATQPVLIKTAAVNISLKILKSAPKQSWGGGRIDLPSPPLLTAVVE